MLGVAFGFVAMILLIGAGLVQIFDTYPISYSILKTISVAYLLYLAWKIANAAPVHNRPSKATPMSFFQAAAFQWVNPKAWAMALTAISAYTPNQSFGSVLIVGAVFGAINLPSVGSWTLMGQQVARILTNPRRLQVFNWGMALLLLASLYPVLWP